MQVLLKSSKTQAHAGETPAPPGKRRSVPESFLGRRRGGMICGLIQRPQADAADALAVGFDYFKLQPLELDFFARRRDMAEHLDEQARDGREVVGFNFSVEYQLDLFDFGAAIDQIGAVFVGEDVVIAERAVFVFDLAENLFDDVFNRHQARHAAVFVYGDGNLHLGLLHIFEQRLNGFALRHEIGRAHTVGHRLPYLRPFAKRQQVAHVDDAFDVIQVLAINGQARVLRFDDQLARVGDGRAHVQRDHLQARAHDFADQRIAELDDRLDHLAFALFDDALFLADVDEGLNLAQGLVFALGLFFFF